MRKVTSSSAFSTGNSVLRRRLRKLALLAGALAIFCYLAGVTAGYLWLRHGRGVEDVRVLDVALLRVDAVRETLGRQHFARARIEAAGKNFQAAYISYASGLRQAPDDIAGRLDAAAFMRSVGALNQSLAILEEGLARHPDSAELIRVLFDRLLESKQSRHALDLLRRTYGRTPKGPNALLLLTYEIRATLLAEGPAAAVGLLERHPELRSYAPVAPILAQVLWESSERLRAIGMLQGYVARPEATMEDFLLLASWQQSAEQPEDAVRTAEAACRRFPAQIPARVILIEARAALMPGGTPSRAEVTAYLRDFAGRPEALASLAMAAGKRGWVPLTRALYDFAAVSQPELSLFSLAYADALARNSRFVEFKEVLRQAEEQSADTGTDAFLVQLRLRQVIAAAALRESDNVREYARRLASLVSAHPEQLDTFRQFFLKTGLQEAVAELTARTVSGRERPVAVAGDS